MYLVLCPPQQFSAFLVKTEKTKPEKAKDRLWKVLSPVCIVGLWLKKPKLDVTFDILYDKELGRAQIYIYCCLSTCQFMKIITFFFTFDTTMLLSKKEFGNGLKVPNANIKVELCGGLKLSSSLFKFFLNLLIIFVIRFWNVEKTVFCSQQSPVLQFMTFTPISIFFVKPNYS